MTEEEVERVAREWCRLAGADPDAMVGHGAAREVHGEATMIPLVWLHSPRWMLVAGQVRERARMDEALKVLQA